MLSPVPDFHEDHADAAAAPDSWAEPTARALGRFATDVSASAGQLSAAARAFAAEAARLIAEAAKGSTVMGAGPQDPWAAAQGLGELREISAAVVEAALNVKGEVAGAVQEARAIRSGLEDLGREIRGQIATDTAEAIDRLGAEGSRCSEQISAAGANASIQTVSEPDRTQANEVLDRLESDYKLLREIVGDLHKRVVALGQQEIESSEEPAVMATEAPSAVEGVEGSMPEDASPTNDEEGRHQAATVEPWHEFAGISVALQEPAKPVQAEGEAVMEGASPATPVPAAPWLNRWRPEGDVEEHGGEGATAGAGVDIAQETMPVGAADAVAEPPVSWTPGPPPAPNGVWVEGRVSINVEPVPDFDRLLKLDSALNRLPAVRSVTLTDYSEEEVSFRLDMVEPVEATGIARHLSEDLGLSLEVRSAEPDRLQLRFSAA